MLGKVGMNSAGIGVCLNILPADRQLTGLPVHILLRALLECHSLDDAEHLIAQWGNGKASNITVADSTHTTFAELAPIQPYIYRLEAGLYLHTNHYLTPGHDILYINRACSESRLARLQEFLLIKALVQVTETLPLCLRR